MCFELNYSNCQEALTMSSVICDYLWHSEVALKCHWSWTLVKILDDVVCLETFGSCSYAGRRDSELALLCMLRYSHWLNGCCLGENTEKSTSPTNVVHDYHSYPCITSQHKHILSNWNLVAVKMITQYLLIPSYQLWGVKCSAEPQHCSDYQPG